MALVIDLILIGIVALFTFIGYKQGLVKAAIKILSFIIAIVVSLILYKPVSSIVINNTSIDEKIKSTIVENVKIEEGTKEEPNIIKENLSNKIITGANNTLEEVANSFSIKLIEIAVILLLYIVARIVLKFISALSDLITNLPLIKQANKVGGIIYGFLKGILIVYILLALIYLVSPMIDSNAFGIIDNTILTKEIYNNNILLKIIF